VEVTGVNPGPIIYYQPTKRVVTFNGGSSNVTAIDPREGTVVGTIELGGTRELAAPDAKGMFLSTSWTKTLSCGSIRGR
jgi:hypothetical protein